MTYTITAEMVAAELAAATSLSTDTCLVCPGVLPYWPIWAAAQFASTDDCKQLLQFVHVWRDGDNFQIESTDGHRAFRYRFPAWENGLPTLWRVPDSGLLLSAKPLRKAVSHSKLLTITQDLRAVFHGGPKQGLTELSAVNLAGHYSVHNAEDCGKVGNFPAINQLWPESFTCAPAAPFCFNARYLREWCAVAEKLAINGTTRCEGNSATTPFVWSANYDPRIGQHFSDARIECLIMPVQVRA